MNRTRPLLAACLLLAALPGASTARQAPDRPPGDDGRSTLRLACYNIHYAEGRDGRLDLPRVADTVGGADLVAFQEVDVRFRERSRFEDQVAVFSGLLGMHAAFGPNLLEGEGRYGVALFSRFPIVEQRNHRLPHDGPARADAEPRGLLECRIEPPDGRPLRVFVTHLSHDSRPERLLQVARVRELIGLDGDEPPAPFVLMGDLNFPPDSEEYALLIGEPDGPSRIVDAWAAVGEGDGPTIGLGGDRPRRIDYILVSPDLAPGLRSARVDAEAIGSDHQPVFAELALPPADAPGPASPRPWCCRASGSGRSRVESRPGGRRRPSRS